MVELVSKHENLVTKASPYPDHLRVTLTVVCVKTFVDNYALKNKTEDEII